MFLNVMSFHIECLKMVWFESPSNPLLKVVDVAAVVAAAKKFNSEIIVVVDNTFMSPYFQVCNLSVNSSVVVVGLQCFFLKLVITFSVSTFWHSLRIALFRFLLYYKYFDIVGVNIVML